MRHQLEPRVTLRVSTRRQGFSLIELLIVVAILAALVGVAMPWFNGYLRESAEAKARQDIEVLRSAVVRYQQGFVRRLTGTSFGPLVGATLTELPEDPWGNDYVIDANLGILGTLGADAAIGGEGPDADILVRYNDQLFPVQCSLEGGFGPPKAGVKIRIVTSKPFGIHPDQRDQVPHDVVLIRDHGGAPMVTLGSLGFTVDWSQTAPEDGELVLVCTSPALNTERLAIKETDQVNFSPLVVSFTDLPSPGSPFAADPGDWVQGPQPAGGDFRGLPIPRL